MGIELADGESEMLPGGTRVKRRGDRLELEQMGDKVPIDRDEAAAVATLLGYPVPAVDASPPDGAELVGSADDAVRLFGYGSSVVLDHREARTLAEMAGYETGVRDR